MSKTNRQKELTRGELKSRKRMDKAKKNWVVASATLALGISALGITSSVQAEAWQATTVEEMQTRVKAEDGQYTFQEGDTFWIIGQAINIQPSKLMEWNGFAEGTQYSIPIGTTIYWDGNHVTVKDAEGNVVADKVVQDTDKIDPNKTVAGQTTDIPKNPVVADTNGNVATTKNNNGQATNNQNNNGQANANKPNNSGQGNEPVTPTDPTNPEVKKFAVTVIYKDEAGNILGKDADVQVEENQDFTATAKSFDNFTLVGHATQTVKVTADTTITFTYSKNTVTPPTPVEKFNVTTNFVDEDGNVIANKQVNEVEKGTEFTATAKNIDGYTVRSEATQTVTVDGNKEVTFTYIKVATPVETYTVTTRFVDTEGNELATPRVETGLEKGTSYQSNANYIGGYTVENSVASKVIIVTGDETITFVYVKNEAPVVNHTVTVAFVTTNGTTLDTETATVKEGDDFTATAKTFDGYTLQGNAIQTVTVNGDTTLTFTYKKDAPTMYTINVQYVDTDGNVLKTDPVVRMSGGMKYTVEADEIEGYTLVGDSSQTITVSKDETLTFTYKKMK